MLSGNLTWGLLVRVKIRGGGSSEAGECDTFTVYHAVLFILKGCTREGYYIATLVCEHFSLLCLGVFLRTQYSCSLVCLVLLHRAAAFLSR